MYKTPGFPLTVHYSHYRQPDDELHQCTSANFCGMMFTKHHMHI